MDVLRSEGGNDPTAGPCVSWLCRPLIDHELVTSQYLSPHEWPLSNSHNGRAVGRPCLDWTQEGYGFVMDSTATICLVWNLIEEHPKCTYTNPHSSRCVPCKPLTVRKTPVQLFCSQPVRRGPKEANTTWESSKKWVWKANDICLSLQPISSRTLRSALWETWVRHLCYSRNPQQDKSTGTDEH